MTINIHTFIWLLQKVILHTRIYSSYDSSYECNIASNKQIEPREFYNLNQNIIIDFTKRHNKNEVTLFCTKCDHDFAAKMNTR